jgi:prevent-host-death family protein
MANLSSPESKPMPVTATDAKNRFGQLLEQAQRAPVVIEKAGRRHSVLMSVEQYDLLVASRNAAAGEVGEVASSAEGQAFYARYKDWVDMQNELVEKYGVFGEEYRVW